MYKNIRKNRITLQQLKDELSKYSDVHIKEFINEYCNDGEIYIYKGSKNVKFPLYQIGKKVILKRVGECYIPDSEYSDIYGNIKIYIIDVNIRQSDRVYQVITKKEYLSLGNFIDTTVLYVGNKKIYFKALNLIGKDNPNIEDILSYFNY